MVQRLGVGGHPTGLVAGLEQVVLRLLPILGVGVVVGQHTGELFQPMLEQCLDGLRHAAVDRPPLIDQDAAVGGFLHQRVLEDVLDLRHSLAPADQLHRLKLRHAGVLRLRRPVDHLQHPAKEAAADNRGQLQGLLDLVRQPVDARQDQALHGVGDVQAFDLLRQGQAVVIRIAYQHPLRQQGADHLLDEERVAVGLAQDFIVHRLGQSDRPNQVGDQLPAVLDRHRRQPDLAQLAARMRGGMLAHTLNRVVGVGPAADEHQQRCRGRQRQQMLGQLDGRLVGPMPILQVQHQRLAHRQLLEQLAHAQENLATQRLAVEEPDPGLELSRQAQGQYRGQVRQHLGGALA